MGRKFCFICGNETDELVDGRCKKCNINNVKLIKVPEEIGITMCTKCGLIKIRNTWRLATLEMAVLDKIKMLEKNVDLDLERTPGGFTITATGEGEEVHKTITKINKMVCPICARKFTQYYDSILQLRGNFDDKVIEYIDEQLFAISKSDKKAFYTIKKPKEGFDIRLGSKAAAEKVAERVKRKYKVQIKKSFILVGKKKDKTLYRDTILLRFL